MPRITAGPDHSSRITPAPPAAGTELLVRISELIADLRPDQADLLGAFHRIQHELGYVPREAVPLLAGKFRTTPALVFGAIDFYSEVRTTPPAKTTVEWCSGPACLLKGSLNIRRVLETVLGCAMNQTTHDGELGLRLVQCDGTCHLAPLLRLGGRYIGPLTVSEAVRLARELTGEKEAAVEAAPAEGGETP